MLLGSTYSKNNDPLSAMCVKTDMGFQTVSSSLIALPTFQPNYGKNKPVYKYANGSPDTTQYFDIEIWIFNILLKYWFYLFLSLILIFLPSFLVLLDHFE